jgi:hypothetical protein
MTVIMFVCNDCSYVLQVHCNYVCKCMYMHYVCMHVHVCACMYVCICIVCMCMYCMHMHHNACMSLCARIVCIACMLAYFYNSTSHTHAHTCRYMHTMTYLHIVPHTECYFAASVGFSMYPQSRIGHTALLTSQIRWFSQLSTYPGNFTVVFLVRCITVGDETTPMLVLTTS